MPIRRPSCDPGRATVRRSQPTLRRRRICCSAPRPDRAASPSRLGSLMNKRVAFAFASAAALVVSTAPPADYSVLIRGGTIYDGSGGAPYVGDIALKGDRIVFVA